MNLKRRIIDRYDEHAPLAPDSIARAAEHLVDRDGLGGLTMRSLGRELGVEAMSIYHHIPNKAALEKLLVERLISGNLEIEAASSPDEVLDAYCRGLRSSMLRRPNMVPLATNRLPRSLFDAPSSVAVRDRLVAFGFDDGAAAWIFDAFLGFVIGHVLVEVTDRQVSDDHGAAFDTGLRFLLAGLREELGM